MLGTACDPRRLLNRLFIPKVPKVPKAPRSCPRQITVGGEELLAFNLITRNRVLALSRPQPIDEGLAQVRLHMRVIGGVHQYHGILVEQPRVALNENIKFVVVFKRNPAAAIGKQISVAGGSSVERRAHALADFLVPRTFVFRDVDAGSFPEIELADMCARAIAA